MVKKMASSGVLFFIVGLTAVFFMLFTGCAVCRRQAVNSRER